MSAPTPSLQYASRRPRFPAIDWGRVLLVVSLLLGAAFVLQSTFRFYMYDDEGSYAYAAWRVSLGEVPYRDFLTPQMPGFLYWGGLLVWLFGRSFAALRISSLAAMLGATYLLHAINRRLFGRAVAIAAVGVFLVAANVFHNARFYRPEAYMLLFSLAGMFCLLLSEERQRLRYLVLGGAFLGLSACFKLFALLSLAGCYLYLLYVGRRERRPFTWVLQQCLALGAPVALMLGTVAIVFSRITPYFLVAVLEHHTMQGANLTLIERLVKGLRYFLVFAWNQPIFVLLMGLGILALRRGRPLSTLLVWQLPTVLSFFALSRSLLTRHLTYLEPTFATLIALALVQLVQGRWRLPRLRGAWHYRALALVLVCLALWPNARRVAAESNQRDVEPLKLGRLVQNLTSADEVVVADYPGINFAAGRRTTYWVAGISGGAAKSGQITGAALIRELERENVGMVIIHTRYGPQQMTEMPDYADFRHYVQAHFSLIDKYHCAVQQLELYLREDTMPWQPGILYQDQLALTGARIAAEVRGGSVVEVDTRWKTLGPLPKDYHVSLRLVDATGRVWAQKDELLMEEFSPREPVGQVGLQEHKLDVPAEVPTGNYYLVAKVYDLESRYALVQSRAGGLKLPGGDAVIGSVRVLGDVLDAEALGMEEQIGAELAPGLELVGRATVGGTIKAGRDLGAALYWRGRGRIAAGTRLELSLVDGDTVCQRWERDIVEGVDVGTWEEGRVMLGSYVLPLGDDLGDGAYRLEVQAVDQQGAMQGEAVVLADGIVVKGRVSREAALAGIEARLEGVRFGQGIGLLGYDLQREVASGGIAQLTLYWECGRAVEKDYKVFVHLLDGEGVMQGQRDALPGGGEAPTSEWEEGDVVVDRYEVPVAEGFSGGELAVEIGLYDPLTGGRLAMQPSGQDHLILPTPITVR